MSTVIPVQYVFALIYITKWVLYSYHLLWVKWRAANSSSSPTTDDPLKSRAVLSVQGKC